MAKKEKFDIYALVGQKKFVREDERDVPAKAAPPVVVDNLYICLQRHFSQHSGWHWFESSFVDLLTPEMSDECPKGHPLIHVAQLTKDLGWQLTARMHRTSERLRGYVYRRLDHIGAEELRYNGKGYKNTLRDELRDLGVERYTHRHRARGERL